MSKLFRFSDHWFSLIGYFLANPLRCHYILAATATTLSLADHVKEVKTGSSRWLNEQAEFRRFEGRQNGYTHSR
jgi:hypothetical protein